jgi:hypothetical protein
MSRILMSLAIVAMLPGVHSVRAAEPERAAPRNPPLLMRYSGDDDLIKVFTAAVGPDLQFTVECSWPLKEKLTAESPNFTISISIDTDDNKATGNKDLPDERVGTDVWVHAFVRLPYKNAKTEDVFVTRAPVITKDATSGVPYLQTNARIHVEGKTMTILIPMSDLKIRKGKPIRIVVGAGWGDLAEQTVTP